MGAVGIGREDIETICFQLYAKPDKAGVELLTNTADKSKVMCIQALDGSFVEVFIKRGEIETVDESGGEIELPVAPSERNPLDIDGQFATHVFHFIFYRG